MFTTFATVTMANFPRWELITIGWGSVSLITPIPEVPLLNLELVKLVLELAPEICALQIVYGPLETVLLAVGCKTSALGTHM